MPTYDFKCLQCDTTFEKKITSEDRDATQRCTECGSEYTKRLYTFSGGIHVN